MKQDKSDMCDMCEIHATHPEHIKLAKLHELDDTTSLRLAEIFKVLGDPTRIKLLALLSASEMCVCDIADALGMKQSAISHQLRVLKQMDLVKSRREGKTIFYSLADGHITTILSQGLDHIQEDEVR